MGARVLDGKALAGRLREGMRGEVEALARVGVTPGIELIRVGDDPGSVSYVRSKARACEGLGIRSRVHALDAMAGPGVVGDLIDRLNSDREVHGILLQLPLPEGYPSDALLTRILPDKDVDGFHPVNVGRLCLGLPGFVPCTPLGIQRLLEEYGYGVAGKVVAIVGRSAIVGRPLANLLSRRGPGGDATVLLCHSRTPRLGDLLRQADIVIVAAGRPATVSGSMIRAGAVVVDVGVNRVADAEAPGGSRLVGDVDFDSVAAVAAAVSPVPGGVGPMTVAMLLGNTIIAARQAATAAGLGAGG